MSTTRLIALALLLLVCFAASTIAGERWAAMAVHNQGVGPLVLGQTPDEAGASAIAACQRISTTCGANAAISSDPQSFFVSVCCENPERGCVMMSDVAKERAEAEARILLSNAGYSLCERMGAYSARDGRPVH